MKAQKRKRLTAGIAVAMAVAIALTGTFAWMSISQKALNEKVGEANPGGRLHDDFNGTNKDVYVENFAPEGAEPIFARIRLDEYMETGVDAGTKKTEENRNVTPLIENAKITDKTTWKTHIPGAEDDKFHDYWTWTTGGSTIFLPTFNKNKDSLKADINGTYEGTTDGDDTHYDDYKTYTVGKEVTSDAIYDADDNDADEGNTAVEGTNFTKKSEKHVAKATQTAKVLTMEEWKNMNSPMGKYWVYDKDGWAYWAEPIEPGEATGLLLNEISLDKMPNDNWYYAINVVGQFVTADDIGSAEDGKGLFSPEAGEAPTPEAMALLNQATTAKIVTGADGKKYQSYGDNTFREVKEDGTLGDQLILGGADGKPDSTQEQPNIVELETPNETYGSKFLGPQDDGSYLAVGPDGKLGTEDDIKVWGNPTLADGITPVKIVTGADGKKYQSYGDNTFREVKEDGTLGDQLILGGAEGKPDSTQEQPNIVELETPNETYGSKFLGPQDDGSYLAAGPDGKLGTGDDIQVWGNPTLEEGIVEECPVDTVTVTTADNVDRVKAGGTLAFSAKVTGNGIEVTDPNVTWEVTGNQSTQTTISDAGVLSVAADEAAADLTVTATAASTKQRNTVIGTKTVHVVKVTSVDVTADGSATSVKKGGTLQYTATVTGNNLTTSDKGVTWTVEGNNSTNTKISTSGLLTVGADETATSITVKATSKFDASVSKSVTVKVKSVTVNVTPTEGTVKKGGTLQIEAEVTGNNLTESDKGVTWAVEGNNSTDTKISTSGLLTVASNETAESITVKATSKFDTSVSKSVTVKVKSVTSVGVTPTEATVKAGETQNYTATVDGNNLETGDKGVTWTVTGGVAGTTISNEGLLNVASNETAESITVKATSKFDTSKSATATVKVKSLTLVTVSAKDDATIVERGKTLQYTATITGNNLTESEKGVTWTVEGNSSNGTSIDTNGLLTVGSDEEAALLTIKATSKYDESMYATVSVNVKAVTSVTVTSAGNATSVTKGKTLQYTATVNGNNLTSSDKGVTWTVTGKNSANTKISTSGLLTVGSDETATSLTIKATSTMDTTKIGTKTVTVKAPNPLGESAITTINGITAGSTTTVTIDGVQFYVAVKDTKNNRALLWTKSSIGSQTFGTSQQWSTSTLRTYLNGDWLNTMPTLKQVAVQTSIKTRETFNSPDWNTTTTKDKVFVFSEADVFGTIQDGNTASANDYTYGTTKFVTDAQRDIGKYYWLRSPGSIADAVAIVGTAGDFLGSNYCANDGGVRPALWVNLAS